MGPVFANLVLADEINRAPAKVQSALLECMQERQVTIGDETHGLEDPFLVMATQNPIEQEGTYPLPEAQVDRFMLKVKVTYPSRQDERMILDRMASGGDIEVRHALSVDQVLQLREVVEMVYIDDKIKDYIVDLVHATRFPEQMGLNEIAPLIENGASQSNDLPRSRRSGTRIFTSARLRYTGRCESDWSRRAAPSSCCYYEAEAEEIDSERIVQQLFDHVEVP